ncbi:hypothetical protein [Paracoccus sp. (in: a-proteobacteria)]|uniref:hypothetical protein n=1 Tax=Paracoccus sp. TaxID=267 RepID=UPI003A8C2D65
MIAVDAESGAVLGALDAQFMERTEGGKASRRSRAFEDRQSQRWLQATQRAGLMTGAARVTVVADREADIFGLFAHRPAHVHLLVRAMHDRVLMEGGKLAERIADGPRLGYAALDLPAGPGRPATGRPGSCRAAGLAGFPAGGGADRGAPGRHNP